MCTNIRQTDHQWCFQDFLAKAELLWAQIKLQLAVDFPILLFVFKNCRKEVDLSNHLKNKPPLLIYKISCEIEPTEYLKIAKSNRNWMKNGSNVSILILTSTEKILTSLRREVSDVPPVLEFQMKMYRPEHQNRNFLGRRFRLMYLFFGVSPNLKKLA